MQDIEIKRYGTRNWAVYVGGKLLAVTVYKKGALAVAMQIGELMEGASGHDGGADADGVDCSGEQFMRTPEDDPLPLRLHGAA